MPPTTEERRHLARAVALAGAVSRTASPNPGVGCVLATGDEVVAEGATTPVGGPHAEAVALAAAGQRARGTTALVTLEPCAHHGRTPPCADALIAAGVRRVVFVQPDPNRPAAGGADRLRAAGVEVVGPADPDDPYRGAVAAQLEAFLTRVRTGRPHVTLKLAQATDGAMVATGQRWLTGPPARTAVHRWRAGSDAVLVGSGTVLADDPGLDVRHVNSTAQPRAVVLDARLRTPPSARVARPGTIVVTVTDGSDDRAARRRELVARGVLILDVPPAPTGGVSLRHALEALADQDVASVFAEPGRTLAAALVADGLVDRLVLHVASHLGSGTPVRAVTGAPRGGWRTERCGGVGTDLILHLLAVGGGEDGRIDRPEPTATAQEVV